MLMLKMRHLWSFHAPLETYNRKKKSYRLPIESEHKRQAVILNDSNVLVMILSRYFTFTTLIAFSAYALFKKMRE